MSLTAEKEPSAGYLESLKEFSIDHSDVREPIRIEPGKYIVLILNRDLWATWHALPAFEIPKDTERILDRATLIQCTPVNFPTISDNLAFRRLVANGIASALAGDHEGAQATFTRAENYISARAGETSRLWYVQSSLVTTLLFVIVGSLTELPWGWAGGEWAHIGMGMAFGAIGALFSFLSRLRKMDVDAASGRYAHYIDAAVRILLGALGALILAVGIRANLVLGFVKSTDGDFTWLLYVFCTVAGASERLVPDFLHQVEAQSLKQASK
jgi:hypothetical protein